MNALRRVSPVSLPADSAETEKRNGYLVVLKYKNEKENFPWIVDLSHRTKFDFQCNGDSAAQEIGIDLPRSPGKAVCTGPWLVSALSSTQFSFIHIKEDEADLPNAPGYTDITDGRCLLAIGGNGAGRLMEKMTRMNVNDPSLKLPCVLQGPLLHTVGQLHILEKDGQKVFLINLGRGYARSIVHALMDIGDPYGLTPSGEDRFTQTMAI